MNCVTLLPPERLPELTKLGAEFYAEAGLPGAFVPERFVESWTRLLKQGFGSVHALIRDSTVVGALGAILHPDINDGELIASEAFWFVGSGERGAGLRLLKAFEEWAVKIGARRVLMVHLMTPDAERISHVYQRLGYHLVEAHYCKELN